MHLKKKHLKNNCYHNTKHYLRNIDIYRKKIIKWAGEKRIKKEKKWILETHRSTNYDIISIIRKILTKQIQQHQRKLLIMTRVGHIIVQR
jgi:hypothetical protein